MLRVRRTHAQSSGSALPQIAVQAVGDMHRYSKVMTTLPL